MLTHKNVPTPIRTTSQLMLASLSLPLPPALPLPAIMPELRRFHHCHGERASKTLMKLSSPSDARPFKKCSVHEASSSSVRIGSIFAPILDRGADDNVV